MPEQTIPTISMDIQIKCKRCEYEGLVTVKREYYINCPQCEELIYVGRLTGTVK